MLHAKLVTSICMHKEHPGNTFQSWTPPGCLIHEGCMVSFSLVLGDIAEEKLLMERK